MPLILCILMSIVYHFFYDEYGKTWFTSLSDLKKAVLEPNEKLVKIHENYWEIEEKEEC